MFFFLSVFFVLLAQHCGTEGFAFDSHLNLYAAHFDVPINISWYDQIGDTYLWIEGGRDYTSETIPNTTSFYVWTPQDEPYIEDIGRPAQYTISMRDIEANVYLSSRFTITTNKPTPALPTATTTVTFTPTALPTASEALSRDTSPTQLPSSTTSEAGLTSPRVLDIPPSPTSDRSIEVKSSSSTTDQVTTSASTSSTTSAITLPTKSIAAIASGTGALLLFLASLATFLLLRRRRREKGEKSKWEAKGVDNITGGENEETKPFSGGKQELDSISVAFPLSKLNDIPESKEEQFIPSPTFPKTENVELDSYPLVSPISPTTQELPSNPISTTPITPHNSTQAPTQVMIQSMLHSRSPSQDLNHRTANEYQEMDSATNTIPSAAGRKDLENASATTNTTTQQIPSTLNIGHPIADDRRRSTEEIAELY